jgi:threonine/homoserine/homoserine lactone efflux protein
MLSPEQLLGFLLAAVAVTASPGPDNLMVLGIGVSRGRRQGIAFGLGCALGCLSHTLLAVVGVSALVAASPLALTALKVVGGAYLVWLGVKSLRSQGQLAVDAGAAETGAAGLRDLFAQGLLANAINPKVILFFLAFLPQFVRVGQGPVAWQMTALGLAFTAQAALLFGLLGYFAGSVGQWLQRWPRAGLWLDRVAGLVFIGLGARLILAL